jgi:protein-tyrosine phosphatase
MNEKRVRTNDDDECIIIRKFRLKQNNKERTITHLQYTGWTDFGAPEHPIGILQLVHDADKAHAKYQQKGPMVVHCSAGCGRSGTFCVIDTMIQRLWLEREAFTSTTHDKVLETVGRFREQRMSMVQTHRQFVFCYEAILWWLLGYGHLPLSSCSALEASSGVNSITMTSSPLPSTTLFPPTTTSTSSSVDNDDDQASSVGSIVDDFKDVL